LYPCRKIVPGINTRTMHEEICKELKN